MTSPQGKDLCPRLIDYLAIVGTKKFVNTKVQNDPNSTIQVSKFWNFGFIVF